MILRNRTSTLLSLIISPEAFITSVNLVFKEALFEGLLPSELAAHAQIIDGYHLCLPELDDTINSLFLSLNNSIHNFSLFLSLYIFNLITF